MIRLPHLSSCAGRFSLRPHPPQSRYLQSSFNAPPPFFVSLLTSLVSIREVPRSQDMSTALLLSLPRRPSLLLFPPKPFLFFSVMKESTEVEIAYFFRIFVNPIILALAPLALCRLVSPIFQILCCGCFRPLSPERRSVAYSFPPNLERRLFIRRLYFLRVQHCKPLNFLTISSFLF